MSRDCKDLPPIQIGAWPQEIALLVSHHDQLAQEYELDGEYDTAEVLRDRARHLRAALVLIGWGGGERASHE